MREIWKVTMLIFVLGISKEKEIVGITITISYYSDG